VGESPTSINHHTEEWFLEAIVKERLGTYSFWDFRKVTRQTVEFSALPSMNFN